MKTCSATPLLPLLIAGLIGGVFFSSASTAEVVNHTHWRVQSGDSVYGIARKLYPDDSKQRSRLRRELIQTNPQAFQNGASNLKVGQLLKLPAFAVKQPETPPPPAAEPVKPSPVAPAAIASTPAQVNEGDPEEIVGQVLINLGNTQASNRGSVRTLKRHSNIFKGDTLITDKGARAQIRMKDGALLALRSDSQLKLVEYNYAGREDGNENSLLELLRGGFRTITGAIGRTNKQNYRVKTTNATIGIRGTHYGLMLCTAGSCQGSELPDGLYGGVVDGTIVTENDLGTFTFNNDEYFHIASVDAAPVQTLLPPPIFTDEPIIELGGGDTPENGSISPQQTQQLRQQAEKRIRRAGRTPGELRGMFGGMVNAMFNNIQDPLNLLSLADINTSSFAPPLPPKSPNGSGIAIAFTHLDASGRVGTGVPIYVTDVNGNNIFLENFTLPDGNVIQNLPFAIYEQSVNSAGQLQQHEANRTLPTGVGATYTNLGGDGGLGVNWGRWNGPFVLLENGQPIFHDQNLHYIYSPNLTPLANLFNLGGLRSRIQLYRFAGGTFPTNHLGVQALNAPDILLDVDFVNYQLLGYSVKALVDDIDWFAQLQNPVGFNQLGNNFDISGPCHGTQCIGQASIMFVGNAAGGAMTSYSMTDIFQQGISGSALLTPMQLNTTPDNFAALFAFENTFATGGDSVPVMTHPGSIDNIYVFNGSPVVGADQYVDPQGIQQYRRITVNPSQATLSGTGNDTVSVPNTTISWGRWDTGTLRRNNSTDGINEIMFIQSNNLTTPSQLGGLSGTASYTTVNGTFNAQVNNLPKDGGFVNMSVNFDTATVTSFTANASQSVTVLEGTASNIPFQALDRGFTLTNSAGCIGGTCSGTASAAFVGSSAEGAITSFYLQNAAGDSASGTALVTRP